MTFNLGQATGIITLDASGVNRAVGQAQRSFDSLLGNIGGNVQRLGQRMQGIGMQTSLAFLPVTAFVAGGIRAFANFDAVLTEIEARTGATAEQMELVRATALQLGQDSAFSATQASDAMLQLLSSGYNLEETFTALPDVLNLAAAGTLDLGYAADAVTDILAQFSLGADQAGTVADALAQAAGASSATVSDLVLAFANVGPVASNMGLSIEETAAAIAVFSENGIKGAEAGTQLRSMLNMMTSDTADVVGMWDELGISMYDSQGNMRDLDSIIDDLNIAMDGMNDEERNRVIRTLGGAYGQMGLSALLASDGIDQMTTAMDNAADAETVARAQMSSFRGAITMLKSSLETISINVLGPLVDNYLHPLIDSVTVLANKFNAWAVANPSLAAGLGMVLGVLAAIGPIMMIGGQALTLIGMGISAVGVAIAFVLSPIGLFIAAIVGLYYAFQHNFLGIRDFLQPFIDLVGETLPGAIDQVVLAFRLFITPVQAFLSSLRNGASITEAFAFAWSRAALILPMAWDTFKNTLLSTFGMLGGWLWDNIFAPAWAALANGFNVIKDAVGAVIAPFRVFFDTMKSSLTSISTVTDLLFYLQEAIGAAFGWQAANIFTRFVFFFVNGFNTLVDIMRRQIGRIGDLAKTVGVAATRMLRPLADAAIKAVDGLRDMVQTQLQTWAVAFPGWVADTLIPGWVGLWERVNVLSREWLPRLGAAIGDGLRTIIRYAIPAVAALLGAIAVALYEFLGSGGMGGVLGFFNNVFEGIAQGVVEGFGIIWQAIGPAVREQFGQLKTYWESGALVADLKTGLRSLFAKAMDGLNDLGQMLWDRVITPAIDALKNYFTSGQAWADLSAFGGWLLGALRAGWDALADVGGWLFDNLISPAIDALANYIGSGAAAADLSAFAGWLKDRLADAWNAAGDLAGWAWRTFTQPIMNGLTGEAGLAGGAGYRFGAWLREQLAAGWNAFTDFPGWAWRTFMQPIIAGLTGGGGGDMAAGMGIGGNAFYGFGVWLRGALKTAWDALGDAGQWAWDNLILPMVNAMLNYINTGGLAVDMNRFGVWLRQAFIDGWQATFAAGEWVWNAFVQPILDAINGGGGGGEGFLGTGGGGGPLEGLGRWLLQATADAIAFVFVDMPVWVWDNILDPILQGLLFPDHDFSAGGESVISLIFTAIRDGIVSIIGSVGEWVNTHLLAPMSAAIMVAPAYLAGAVSTFTNWLVNTITTGYRRLAGLAQQYIVDPVRAAIQDLTNINVPGTDISVGSVLDTALDPLGIGNTILGALGGHQAGTPWTGWGPVDQLAGGVHNREAVIPHGGMTVYPSPRGLMLGGDIGQLLMGMMSGAMSNAMPALAGASSGGGGDTYNISVPITVDAAMLAEPGMMERAQRFGQETGDSAMDAIMKRRRSRGG